MRTHPFFPSLAVGRRLPSLCLPCLLHTNQESKKQEARKLKAPPLNLNVDDEETHTQRPHTKLTLSCSILAKGLSASASMRNCDLRARLLRVLGKGVEGTKAQALVAISHHPARNTACRMMVLAVVVVWV